ncbi:uncharacterized protein K02A2.6-like [Armigeres subalbatus]|uniref:uncharacterized protein K02A2.6-like n=1 Tax=Armigeres subalbatus TaxID=124917 RepID=UPI002ED44221
MESGQMELWQGARLICGGAPEGFEARCPIASRQGARWNRGRVPDGIGAGCPMGSGQGARWDRGRVPDGTGMEETRSIPMFRCEQIESGKLAKEWQEWKRSLEYYFEACQLHDQKMMRSKMLHLGGPQLQKVFGTLEGTEDFPLLKDCGLEKYSHEVKSVLEETMLIDVIVEGCISHELRRKILEKDQSLSDIEALGESLESVRIQEQELKIGKSGTESGFNEICKVQNVLKSRKERREDRIASRFATPASSLSKDVTCPAKDQICRRCRKTGHFENVCRKQPESRSSAPPKKVQIVENVQDDIYDSPQPTPQPVQQPDPQPMTHRTAAERKVYYTFYTGGNTNVFDCTVGGVKIDMFIDSGSDVNLVTSDAWEKLKAQQVVVSKCERGSSKILKAYASSEPLTILGTFQAEIKLGRRSINAEFLVIKNGQRNLLGDTTSKELGILKIGLESNRVTDDNNRVSPFSKIVDTKVRISMDPSFTPVFQPLRRIPIPLEGAVNQKLDELLRRDIIEPKEGPASWVSPLVVANKANGTIRLCVDLRRVNQAVIRERHPMPVIDEVLAKIGRGKVWSVLDVKDAFFLLELEEESRNIVTFITHRGLYRFKRLPFGLVSAPEIFQRKMDEILADCEGIYWYLDDIGVEGSTIEEHDARLEKVLKRFEEKGVILNWEKCKIRVTDFEFLGYHINPQGIMPSDSKRNAILSFRQPQNESEVRSFLGLANYMGKFIPELAAIDEPLRRLTQKDVKFHWGEKEESAFHAIKQKLASAERLGFYKLEDQTSVIADASPHALGGVLVQTDTSGVSRVICYASKSLTDTERRYCQTEKEALALVWSVERFQIYLIGREFNLLTDCKALTFLFTPVSRPCARIERWVLRLQSFQYKIVHISGHTNIADVLSRLSTSLPIPFDEMEELVVNEIFTAAAKMIAVKWEEIENISRDDPEIMEISQALRSEILRADNGPQFSSEEFRSFCEEYGIHLESTIPYWPQMNGEVERQNRSILKRLRIAQELGQNWKEELRKYLLMYHSTAHTTTGKAPAELMLGRKVRTKLPYVPVTTAGSEALRDRDRLEKEKGKDKER